ncbi:unnamed protein product [Pleuronectes platessa]|uniref:Uncharacterized protein n=1 Tax=Pleuronectes platessa TaxID=8262 RepID=A0A9N7YEL9_PLEPL|nr:unnamed protein product [Pleuronectes platessa]
MKRGSGVVSGGGCDGQVTTLCGTSTGTTLDKHWLGVKTPTGKRNRAGLPLKDLSFLNYPGCPSLFFPLLLPSFVPHSFPFHHLSSHAAHLSVSYATENRHREAARSSLALGAAPPKSRYSGHVKGKSRGNKNELKRAYSASGGGGGAGILSQPNNPNLKQVEVSDHWFQKVTEIVGDTEAPDSSAIRHKAGLDSCVMYEVKRETAAGRQRRGGQPRLYMRGRWKNVSLNGFQSEDKTKQRRGDKSQTALFTSSIMHRHGKRQSSSIRRGVKASGFTDSHQQKPHRSYSWDVAQPPPYLHLTEESELKTRPEGQAFSAKPEDRSKALSSTQG